MWEAIHRNIIYSRVLVGLLGAILVVLGFTGGLLIDPDAGGPIGVIAALGLWLLLYLLALFQGDTVLLMSARARQVGKEDAPQLWNVVEEMKIASGLPAMPRVYVIDDDAPNAFAVGRKPESAAVAVTTGLLRELDRDELQGVIAHEIGHITNGDIRFMTMASVMLGTILIISDLILRSLWYGGGRSVRRRGSKVDPRVQIAILLIGILFAVLAPILAQVLYFASSRKREYLADASSARFTRYPAGLASALEKISARASSLGSMNRAIAPLLTVNPAQGLRAASIFSTHPPTERRIAVLRGMGGKAGLLDYEAAFKKVSGGGARILGLRTLTSAKSLAARSPSPEATAAAAAKSAALDRARDVCLLLDRLGGLLAIACPCGLRIKLPQDLDRPSVACPRCGREHEVPRAGSTPAGEAAMGAGAPGSPGAAPAASPLPPLRYERRSAAWESFRCECGRTIQLSPILQAPSVICPACRREIEIVLPGQGGPGGQGGIAAGDAAPVPAAGQPAGGQGRERDEIIHPSSP
jgi:heat shock protein HtpX